MLIIDNHDSHMSIKFNNYCKFNKIVIVSMLMHLFHLLQPLDIKLYLFLKFVYNY